MKETINTGAPSSRRSLLTALVLTACYLIVEVVSGFAANSLALLADAGHMLTDVASLGLALAAIWIGTRPASVSRSFGFQRAEILAAVMNAASLWLVAIWIFLEAYRRFQSPEEVRAPLMLVVGLVGLAVNVAVALILRRSARHSINVEGALLHVFGDILGSLSVVAAGGLILLFGWWAADPIFGAITAVLIIVSSVRLLWKALHVLMESSPRNMDVRALCQRMEQVTGVLAVHDIHVWSITPGYDILSAHVSVATSDVTTSERILQQLRQVAAREFGIMHVTIQLETAAECVENHHIPHGVV